MYHKVKTSLILESLVSLLVLIISMCFKLEDITNHNIIPTRKERKLEQPMGSVLFSTWVNKL